jgi:hypothetical protein
MRTPDRWLAPSRILASALVALATLVLVSSASSRAAAQKVRVTMISSATQVSVGDPFVIEIRADLNGDEVDDIAIPDFGKLEVLGRRMSRPMSFSFGFGSGGQRAQVQSQIVHGFTLRATEPGTFVIQPAIVSVNGRKFASQKLSIVATGAAMPQPPDPSAAQGSAPQDLQEQGKPGIAPPDGPLSGAQYDSELFLRSVVDKQKVQLGEQVTITVYLYVHGGLSQNPSITREPTTEGFWVQDLLPVQRTLAPVRQEVNGRTYNVYVLRRFAAFPLRAGALKVGAPSIELQGGNSLFDLVMGPTQTVRRNGVEVPIEALALPGRAGGPGPTHVGSLTLESSIEPAEAKIGDAVTLRVVAKGQGNLKALKLADPKLDGLDVLAPEIEDKVTTDLDVVGGERVFRWLLLPRKPGAIVLPSFEVNVFDPEKKAYSLVRSQALTLNVSGAASAAQASDSTAAKPSTVEREGSELTRSFGPARVDAVLARPAPRMVKQPWFWWAVLAAPLACLGVWLGRAATRRLRVSRAGSPGDQAMRSAEQKLKEAEERARAGDAAKAYAALFSGLRSALSARLDEPVGGLTLPALERHCIERGMAPALAERIVGTLSAAEQARFDPSQQTAQTFASHLREGQALVREIARFVHKGAA